MRILNRPMFRYGGPIKEGIMQGMKNGGLSKQFNTGLVGDERYPQTGGREHHGFFIPPLLLSLGLGTGARVAGGAAIRAAGSAAARRAAQEAATKVALSGGAKETIKKVASTPGGWKNLFKNYWSGDPAVKGSKWTWKTLTSPGANTLAQKAVRGLLSPSSLALTGGITWYMWPDGTKRKTPPPGGGRQVGPPGGGDPGMYYDKPPVTKTPEELAAEAKAARTKKLNKYLDTMGYDKAKKGAIGDALIDASAIVQQGTEEGGSLKHADWGKMINQAIQATSQRLKKPEQIREAVGLMLTKSEIEKDLEDPQVKKLRALEIETREKALEEGFEKDMREFILARKDAPDKKQIETFARLTADEYNIYFKKVSDKELQALPEGASQEEIINQIVTGDGVYMIGDAIIRVTDGIPKHIG